MKAGSWRKRLLVLGLAAGWLLFLGQVWQGYQGMRRVPEVLWQPGLLLAALGLTCLCYCLQMLAWVLIMRYLGAPISMRAAIGGYLSSFLARYVPGTVWGYWTRGAWLAEEYGVGYYTSSLGSALEMGGFAVTAACVALVYWASRQTGPAAWLLLAASLILAILSVGPGPVLLDRAARRALPVLTRLTKKEIRLPQTPLPWPGRNWTAALGLYLLLWLCYGASVGLIMRSVAPDLAADLAATTFAFSLSWLIGFLIILVPTGIGVREWTMTALLISQLGAQPWQASAIAVGSRFATILAELIWLLVGTAGRLVRRPRGAEDGLKGGIRPD